MFLFSSNTLLTRAAVRRSLINPKSIHTSFFAKKDFKLVDIGEGIVQVEILKWFVKPGDRVQQFDKLVEVQSDKATVEITSKFSGVIKSVAVEEGKIAKVGQVLVQFEEDDTHPSSEKKPISSAPIINTQTKTVSPTSLENHLSIEQADDDKILATPAVRHLARENGIRLSFIKGTGKDGRIMKSDILEYIEKQQQQSSISTTPQPTEPKIEIQSPLLPSATLTTEKFKVIPITGIKREMGKLYLNFKAENNNLSSENDDFSRKNSPLRIYG